MNIKEAKAQIENAMRAYFTKDEFGEYLIPIERQRPVFLMGPPGIGKTAIMEQISQDLGVGLVSYSMTHHTRQSALGLPFIVEKEYGGKMYSVSEYTMSEIIASVYDLMEETGLKEGILFLDEINCVSETLAPAMLQFLQYKIFGRHRVPDGWIIVTAGNPPEYNNSVREFDIVTWDRLKRIDVKPDYTVWKEYANKKGTHPAITTYLDIKKGDFYRVESTVDGKSFVTARGWSDLSDMIYLYEKHGFPVDEQLISQYLQNRKIAKDFSVYYDLFNKYRSDYQVDKILAGQAPEEIKTRAMAARFDERLSLLGLILDQVNAEMKGVYRTEGVLRELMGALKNVGQKRPVDTEAAVEAVTVEIEARRREIRDGRTAGSLSDDRLYTLNKVTARMEEEIALLHKAEGGKAPFDVLKEDFNALKKSLMKEASEAKTHLSNVFKFCEAVFPDGQEMLILVTELTAGYYSSSFLARYGCDEYFAHNKELLFYERHQEIIKQIEGMEL